MYTTEKRRQDPKSAKRDQDLKKKIERGIGELTKPSPQPVDSQLHTAGFHPDHGYP